MMKYELFSVQDFAKHNVKIFHEVPQWRKKVKAKYREQSVNSGCEEASVSTTKKLMLFQNEKWRASTENQSTAFNFLQSTITQQL